MSQNGDDATNGTTKPDRASKLAELASWTAPEPSSGATGDRTAPELSAETPYSTTTGTIAGAAADSELESARREFARLLGEFRRTAVLVPFDEHDSLWTADQNGVRWICAFSNEEALARFALARGETRREWKYRTVLGARLLDAMVPVLPGPGGVALDAGSADGMLFPPVRGIVPEAVAVDLGETGEGSDERAES
ncbi:SseB family protein [Streptomyces sp. WMMC940]|uniref:SseB family protein n=1 Tax=Streptomyces sp. WMMC940 TaxID=3015153 RepID=UPI0022B6C612|nr:SseB family protein [Streptomyces sp. WMMC940]MCZ7459684.1 SseB family protein [Streptomyces sp. WMMC940]